MTGWLASVMDVSEAQQVMNAGASIIDAKNPYEGALGALPLCTVRAIVDTVGGRVPVSATVGDFPSMEPHSVIQAVNAVGATGVDFVKIGLFPAPKLIDCLEELAPLCRQFRLVAVLFADQNPDLQLADRLAELGFSGVMLDTMDKSSGWLLRHQPVERLAHFVTQARNLNLISGLAGSLRAVDISVLRPLNPDYLGFRGALCHKHTRTQTVDFGALAAITKALAKGDE